MQHNFDSPLGHELARPCTSAHALSIPAGTPRPLSGHITACQPQLVSLAACLLLVTAVLIPASGCVSRDLTFELENVQQASVSEDGVVLQFELEGINASPDELPLGLVRYELILDGQLVFTGERVAEASVPAFGRQPFEIPVAVSRDDFDITRFDRTTEAIPYQLTGSAEYLVPGQLAEVLFDTGLRRTKAPISLEGAFEITDPGAARQTPDSQSLQ